MAVSLTSAQLTPFSPFITNFVLVLPLLRQSGDGGLDAI